MDNKKLKVIESVALEYFEQVKVYTQEDDPVSCTDLVGLRGIYKGNSINFDYNIITNIYNLPLFHMEKELRKTIGDYFSMNENGNIQQIKQ